MVPRTAFLPIAAFIVTIGLARGAIIAQRPADVELPPITWLCPMNGVLGADGTTHADVYDDKKGNCPICKMALVAARLDSIWTCPIHSVIAEKNRGTCPIDRRDLVQITVSVSWTCSANPEIDQITPGRCPDGSAMIVRRTPRPHGNHNPQHGGLFFMASDNWTHLEATFPQAGVVRIYLYDNYTKPLPREAMTRVQGRIITTATVRENTRENSFTLVPSRNARYLEARIDTRTLPAALVAKLKLRRDGPEHHFDLTFSEFSREPSSTPIQSTARSVPQPTASDAPTPAQAPGGEPHEGPPSAPAQTTASSAMMQTPTMANPVQIKVEIPASVEEIVSEITSRNQKIRELVDAGRFTEVWLPAFEAKDLALAISAHSAQMPTYKRRLVEPAIRRLLHAAWLLDAFGDLGNREQVNAAYADFRSAVSGIEALVAGTP